MKVLFVCLGNICRSPMAEYIFKYLTNNKYIVESRGTSDEEEENDIHYGTKKMLDKNNIPYTRHYAKNIAKEDFNNFDLLVCFDSYNYNSLVNLFGNSTKIIKLLDKDIDDPWYTGNFEKTYNEIYDGCVKLQKRLEENL